MSEFDLAFPVVIEHEGGYSDDRDDPGGATKYGLSLRFLTVEGLDLDHDGDVDADDVRHLTASAAMCVYRERLWDRWGYERIIDSQVATKVFDMCVNLGPKRAHRLLQRALCECNERVDVDGVLGPKTIQATNRCEARELLMELCSQHALYYRTLVELKPRFEKYLRGWMKRAFWPFGANEYIPTPVM